MRIGRYRTTTLSFWLSAALLVALGAFVVSSARQFVADSRWLDNASTVKDQVDQLALLERSGVAAFRGYILSGDPELRREFFRAREQLPHRLEALKNSTKQSTVAENVSRLEPRILARFDFAERVVSAFDERGMLGASEFIKANRGPSRDAEIRGLLARVSAAQLEMVAERRAESEKSALWLLVAAGLGIPLTLTLLGAGQRLLHLEIAKTSKSETAARASAAQFESLSVSMKELSNYNSAVQSCTSREDLFQLTGLALAKLLPGLSGAIYLNRPESPLADVAWRWGETGSRATPPSVADDCVMPETPRAPTACIPLHADGESTGWICLVSDSHDPIAGIDLAELVGEGFSLGLANLLLKDKLLHESIRDPLTGLFNRRYLEASLNREIARCVRKKLPLVVLMFDLDCFKAFNDRHGHGGGDVLLSAFGHLLQSHCRAEDIACRFGGEEFILVLPEASLAVGMERANTLLQATREMKVSHLGSPLGVVTSSIGLAVLPADGVGSVALLAAADGALYKAKAAGRDQVVMASAIQPAATQDWPALDSQGVS